MISNFVRRCVVAWLAAQTFVPIAAHAIDAAGCLASSDRARQVAASDAAMVASLQTALGEVDVSARLLSIFQRLTAGNEAASRYKLLGYRGPDFTAHAAAPGIVLVSSRLWTDPVARDDDIAAVLAHELAHLRLSHSQIAGCRALKFVDAEDWEIGAAVQAVLKVAKKEPVVAQAWSAMQQRFEFEADAAALPIMRNAGYDPRALPRLLRRLADHERGDGDRDDDAQEPRRASTHPTLHKRIEALERELNRTR